MIWAAGEFQYPEIDLIPGSKLCLHNSQVESWEDIKGDEIYVIGGYESGIDAAIHLSRSDKKVRVLDRGLYWNKKTTDPSENISPFTLERLRQEMFYKNIDLVSNCVIEEIKLENNKYLIYAKGKSLPYESDVQPILATGFKGSLVQLKELFDWNKSKDYCLLTDEDESTKTPGLFLVGPQVRHNDLIFVLFISIGKDLVL